MIDVIFTMEECPTAEEAKKIIYQFDCSWTDKYCGAHKTVYFLNILLENIKQWVAVKTHQNTDKTGSQFRFNYGQT